MRFFKGPIPIIGLIAILFTQITSAQLLEQTVMHVMCAAANTLVMSQVKKGEESVLTDLVLSEAKRHANIARELGATENDLEHVLRAMQYGYNSGSLPWDEIADFGRNCVDL